VWVAPRPRVLYVESRADAAHYLSAALDNEGIEVISASAQQLPDSPAAWSLTDSVILSDLQRGDHDAADAGSRLTCASAAAGLLFASGENTFGEGGYSKSVLEHVLPAEFKAQEKRKDHGPGDLH
jgi:hypothetical protein